MRAGAERPPGVDDDSERVGRRFLPGRPEPERADPNRPVERTPGVLPARRDILGFDPPERSPQLLLTGPADVGGELEFFTDAPFLETLGGEIDEGRPRVLRILRANAD